MKWDGKEGPGKANSRCRRPEGKEGSKSDKWEFNTRANAVMRSESWARLNQARPTNYNPCAALFFYLGEWGVGGMDLSNFLLNQKEFRSLTPDILLTQTYPQCCFIKVFNTFPATGKYSKNIYTILQNSF